jgi:hypothetical protein
MNVICWRRPLRRCNRTFSPLRFHDVMIPYTVLLMIRSSEDSMIAASSAPVSNIRGFLDFPTRRIDLMATQFECLNPFMALPHLARHPQGLASAKVGI